MTPEQNKANRNDNNDSGKKSKTFTPADCLKSPDWHKYQSRHYTAEHLGNTGCNRIFAISHPLYTVPCREQNSQLNLKDTDIKNKFSHIFNNLHFIRSILRAPKFCPTYVERAVPSAFNGHSSRDFTLDPALNAAIAVSPSLFTLY